MKNTSWVWLIAAAVMEICWLICVKFLNIKSIRSINWSLFFQESEGIKVLMPLIGYLVFGLLNVVFITLAMRTIPMSIAFGVWMSMALIGSSLIDSFYFKLDLSQIQWIGLLLIVIGVLSLKLSK